MKSKSLSEKIKNDVTIKTNNIISKIQLIFDDRNKHNTQETKIKNKSDIFFFLVSSL